MDKSEKFWDRRSKEYEKNEEKYEQTYNKTVEITKSLLTINDVVLDFGCGTGIITNNLAQNVKEIHAIDISSKMIDVARRKADERELTNIIYSQSTIFDDRYKKESFKVILAFNILHLIKDPQTGIQRINDLLKPGGLFISETPCLRQKRSILSILLFLPRKIGLVPFTNFLKFSELEELLTEGDFHLIENKKILESPPKMFIVAKKQ